MRRRGRSAFGSEEGNLSSCRANGGINFCFILTMLCTREVPKKPRGSWGEREQGMRSEGKRARYNGNKEVAAGEEGGNSEGVVVLFVLGSVEAGGRGGGLADGSRGDQTRLV